MNFNDEQKAHILLNCFQKIGPARFKKLADYFSSAAVATKADADELRRAGLEEKIVTEFIKFRAEFDLAKEVENLGRNNIKVKIISDVDYPILLKNIYDPPPILYYRGDWSLFDKYKLFLSIVGSRLHSFYSNQVLSNFFSGLTGSNLVIVSGLALGVDTLAHQNALKYKLPTIAVLGGGIDDQVLYPAENLSLAKDILAAGGLLISEFKFGFRPRRICFPQRNRVISGLSQATLIIEARKKSGALITAYHALGQNREVLAVPGNINSLCSEGSNEILKAGAKVVLSAADILETFNLKSELKFKKQIPLLLSDPLERKIMEILESGKIHINEIITLTKLDTAFINSTLSMMELRGILKNSGAGYFEIAGN